MWAEFLNLFTTMSWIVIVLLSLGIVFCIVEAFVPGFGFFGIAGIISEIAGVVVHAVISDSIPQVLILIVLLMLITMILFFIFVRSAKSGLLAKTPFVENRTSIPVNYGQEIEKVKQEFIGKEGIIIADCHPVGKMRIGEDIFEVLARDKIIEKDELVKIVDIEGTKIYVDKITY